ncbi:MAG: hypothetical protein K5798_00140 [Nitrosopumilus sp.]|uniref:hypothetical protein n=1 Tax=Nitrosopumilus sp. TaxID=2024843 RepID=UPI00242D88C1|nr:hypothetical protein [Nitrosopumilus sp.]MCV0365660.1 hypothetical protein [Nitrosopumilus sp.]
MISFEEFWLKLTENLKTVGTYETLTHGNKFSAVALDDRRLKIIRESNPKEPKILYQSDFKRIWNVMKKTPLDYRYSNGTQNGHVRYNDGNSSVILSLINSIVGNQEISKK